VGKDLIRHHKETPFRRTREGASNHFKPILMCIQLLCFFATAGEDLETGVMPDITLGGIVPVLWLAGLG
jgi:hypothetical protein